jgi:hypothetical protein
MQSLPGNRAVMRGTASGALIGMALLGGSRLRVDVVPGGSVVVQELA